MDVKIVADHPDATHPLLWAAARALTQMGARVEIAIGGENLVRRLRQDARDPDGAVALVQAEGLANLLHELVHAVQTRIIDDDWGIDYGAIPFDLTTKAGRHVLWEELACCTLSCAYLSSPRNRQGHTRCSEAAPQGGAIAQDDDESPASAAARVHAWFREQLGIQPVFYGRQDDPSAFWRRVQALAIEHRDELVAVIDHAYAATETALAAAGAPASQCVPPRRLSPYELLDRAYVEMSNGAPPTR
jgi:hypothetical protein